MTSPTIYQTDFPRLEATDTVGVALRRMLDDRVSDLPVVDASGALVGMFKLDRGVRDAAAAGRRSSATACRISRSYRTRSASSARRCARSSTTPCATSSSSRIMSFIPTRRHSKSCCCCTRAPTTYRSSIATSGRLVGMVSARDLLTALQPGDGQVTHGGAAHASTVIFGLSPLWVATTLFVVTYLVIMSDKLNRAIVALLGAGLADPRRRAEPARGDAPPSTGTRSASCSA